MLTAHKFAAAALLSLSTLLAAALPTAASECAKEMGLALENQRKSGAFRMDVFMISEQGPVKMTVDYLLPDRMRQVVTPVLDPKPVETVLVGTKAWSNQGSGWSVMSDEITRDLIEQVKQTVAEAPESVGRWECLGKLTVDGTEVNGYQGGEAGPVDLSPGAKEKPKNEAVRIVYVDARTGLPLRSIFARPDKLDRPIFKATYSYPKDLRIDPPAAAK